MRKLLNSILQQQIRISVNKFLLEVEEMSCPSCEAITGHVMTGQYWTCCHCGHQIGKQPKKLTWLQRFNKWRNKSI